MKVRHCVSFALLLVITGSMASCFYRSKRKGQTYDYASRIVEVAKKNNKNLTINSLLDSANYDGSESFTNERMLLLLKKAFPDLREPSPYYIGFNKEIEANDWDDYSENLTGIIDYFQRRALYFPERSCSVDYNGVHTYRFSSEAIAKKAELETILRRIQGYIGANPEDDFYSYVNHENLFSDRKEPQSNFVDKNIIRANVKSLIEEIKDDSDIKRSIKNFEESFLDEKSKKEGLGGLKDAINEHFQQETYKNPNKVLKEQANAWKQSILVPFSSTIKLPASKNRKMVNCLILSNPFLPSLSEWYSDLGRSQILLKAYAAFSIYDKHGSIGLNRFLDDYRLFIEKYIKNLETISAQSSLPVPFLPLSLTKMEKLKDKSDNSEFSLENIYEKEKHPYILLHNPYSIKALFKTIKDGENGGEGQLLAFLIYSYVQNYPYCFPREEQAQILAARGEAIYKDEWDYIIPFIANELLAYYKGTEKYKRQVNVLTNLFQKLKSTLKTRFENNEWLDEEGKAKVKKKLDQLIAVIADKKITDKKQDEEKYVFPIHDYKKESNSLYENCNLFAKERILSIMKELGESNERATIYSSDPFMANAYNDIRSNMIHITPGYIFSKKNCDEESMEELLCDYGFVIGHEMTHSFDKNGAKFNEEGVTVKKWLGDKNSDEFAKRNNQVAQFYSLFEEVPGFREKGSLKVTEATADLGGFKLIMDIAKTESNFDYKKLFTLLAKLNYIHINRNIYSHSIMNDSHPIGGGRINPLLMNCDEFKKEYNVKAGDYMYAPSNKQITIW